jgi:hypothetical protein
MKEESGHTVGLMRLKRLKRLKNVPTMPPRYGNSTPPL